MATLRKIRTRHRDAPFTRAQVAAAVKAVIAERDAKTKAKQAKTGHASK
jgi:hypothetical protein